MRPRGAIALGSANVCGCTLALAYGCFFYGSYFIVSWYPTYLLEYRHLSMKSLGLVASLPLISPIFGELTGGWLTDFLFRKTGRLRWSRRIVCAPALLMSAIFVIPAAMTDSLVIAVICLTASFFFLDMVVGPSWAVSDGCGRPVQRHGRVHHEHGGRARRVDLSARLRLIRGAGFLGRAVLRHRGGVAHRRALISRRS